jgi:hypothetical protein
VVPLVFRRGLDLSELGEHGAALNEERRAEYHGRDRDKHFRFHAGETNDG